MMVTFFYFLTWPVLKIFYFTTHINIQNHLNIIYYLTELYQNQDPRRICFLSNTPRFKYFTCDCNLITWSLHLISKSMFFWRWCPNKIHSVLNSSQDVKKVWCPPTIYFMISSSATLLQWIQYIICSAVIKFKVKFDHPCKSWWIHTNANIGVKMGFILLTLEYTRVPFTILITRTIMLIMIILMKIDKHL
jgi:hypothetical protein